MGNILEIKNLKVDFYLGKQIVNAVDYISLDIADNEVLVLAGESGSGKTVTALSIARILPSNAKIVSGSIKFFGRELLDLDESSLTNIRGREISYIFQEPTSFLNPVYTIGNQIIEVIMLHQKKEKKEALAEAVELLNLVKINDPKRVMLDYPHQLSGGMNQRVFMAMALACKPKLLIADEPTTSLDVTIENQILDLLADLKNKFKFSLLFITHNLSIARKIGRRICVMYKGRIVDEGRVEDVFDAPRHFHTRELIKAYERIGTLH